MKSLVTSLYNLGNCFVFILIILLVPMICSQGAQVADNESYSDSSDISFLKDTDICTDTMIYDFQIGDLSFGLPDLEFIELKAWWGPINTSSTGLFVRFGVINTGDEINGTEVVESNLSFFADDNDTHFGYIIQRPLFYPSHWYPGEILGGSFYFNIDERPHTISVFIDSNESIMESDEANNMMSILVVDGISVNGTVFYNSQDQLIPVQSSVELRQCDELSLSDVLYRTFWTDEQGRYALSIYPSGDKNISRRYSLTALDTQTQMRSLKLTRELHSGQTDTIDFVFGGTYPDIPHKPFGRKSGGIGSTYRFITFANDIDSDYIFYKFNWGDGSYSPWLGPFESTELVVAIHQWEKDGIYEISVIAKDSTDLLSGWSEAYQINLARAKPLPPFILFIQDLIDNFLPNKLQP